MTTQTFTEKTTTFKGEYFNMRGFLNSGVYYASKKAIQAAPENRTIAKVTWLCEDPETDIHDLINPEQMELWGIDIISMSN